MGNPVVLCECNNKESPASESEVTFSLSLQNLTGGDVSGRAEGGRLMDKISHDML